MILADIYRHAESASNAGEKTAYPDTIPLTLHGQREAARLALAISETPARLVCSPFLRSADTLAPIARRFPQVPRLVWPVEEFTYLAPDACVGTSWIERKPMIDAYWDMLDPDRIDGPGAESFRQLLARAGRFLDQLAAAGPGLTLVVSHGQFMLAAALLVEDRKIDAAAAMAIFAERQHVAPFANCERMRISADGARMRVTRA